MVGDVVLAPVPFTDLTGVKTRPVLVLADVDMGDWVVCAVTTTSQRRGGDIQLARSDLQGDGLARNSWVRSNRLYTLNESLFLDTLGAVSSAKLAEVSAAARGLFA